MNFKKKKPINKHTYHEYYEKSFAEDFYHIKKKTIS